jgi:hypothetical protein
MPPNASSEQQILSSYLNGTINVSSSVRNGIEEGLAIAPTELIPFFALRAIKIWLRRSRFAIRQPPLRDNLREGRRAPR